MQVVVVGEAVSQEGGLGLTVKLYQVEQENNYRRPGANVDNFILHVKDGVGNFMSSKLLHCYIYPLNFLLRKS